MRKLVLWMIGALVGLRALVAIAQMAPINNGLSGQAVPRGGFMNGHNGGGVNAQGQFVTTMEGQSGAVNQKPTPTPSAVPSSTPVPSNTPAPTATP